MEGHSQCSCVWPALRSLSRPIVHEVASIQGWFPVGLWVTTAQCRSIVSAPAFDPPSGVCLVQMPGVPEYREDFGCPSCECFCLALCPEFLNSVKKSRGGAHPIRELLCRWCIHTRKRIQSTCRWNQIYLSLHFCSLLTTVQLTSAWKHLHDLKTCKHTQQFPHKQPRTYIVK